MDNRIFSHERYNELVKETVDQLVKLGQLKGGEYAGDTDRLANFRRNAVAAGTTMELIWRIYAAKHWDAIMQYERDMREGKTRERLEGLAGRCDDLIVYLILFKAMIEEREPAKLKAWNGEPPIEEQTFGPLGPDVFEMPVASPNYIVGENKLPVSTSELLRRYKQEIGIDTASEQLGETADVHAGQR